MKKVNLTQLRRNARSRKKKKSGRQNPRPGDSDVLPAPDAEKEKKAGKYTWSCLFQYLSNKHKYTVTSMYLIYLCSSHYPRWQRQSSQSY